jgi:subtilisin family serine protease
MRRILPGLWTLWLACLFSSAHALSFPEGQISVILAPGHTIEEVNETWGTTTLYGIPQEGLYLVYKAGVEDLEAFAEQMSQDPAVASAQANYIQETPEAVRQMVIAAVGGSWEDFEDQELTERIGLDAAHQYATGQGILVAVLDTGLDPNHDVFAGRLSPEGWDFVDQDAEPWEEANGVDDDQDGLTDEGFAHGTMVAGLVALVAPDATILPIRVLDDEGRGDAFRIAMGIHYALLKGADVINMSFGVPLDVEIVDHLLDMADALGVLAVAGAGNEDREVPPYYPAAWDRVFMVTALDSLDVKADFADYNTRVLVSAPGVGVRSAYPGNDWGLGSGCSFATPLVTGEAALIRSLLPQAGWTEVEARIAAAVDSIYDIPGNEPYLGKLGTGRIYLPDALADSAPSGVGTPGIRAAALRVWPNPTSGPLRLTWSTAEPGDTSPRLTIHDVRGRLVRVLAPRGENVAWDGRDALGRPVPSGVYFVTLHGVGGSPRRTVHLLR